MTRMIRFKLKYRFWGCLSMDTEALTRSGWKTVDELTLDDEILIIDPETEAMRWSVPQAINVYDYEGELIQWSGRGSNSGRRLDALTTPNHRWLGRSNDLINMAVHSEFAQEFDGALLTSGGVPTMFRTSPKWSDELVETVAWYVCDGSDHVNRQNYHSVHLGGNKPHKVAAWRRLAAWWTAEGGTWNEGKVRSNGQSQFYLGKGVVEALEDAAPNKEITAKFLCSLTYAQARLFRETLLSGDGHVRGSSVRWTQVDRGRRDAFQMLDAMLGIGTAIDSNEEKVQEHLPVVSEVRFLDEERIPYKGQVWCPTVETGFFMARRNGTTYWTGNTALEGTRQVFSFTELWTEDAFQTFINDELIESDVNPLGVIPFVHISNTKVPSSPWGLSDIQDVTDLNRQYNETATLITDIVDYYACVDSETEALTKTGWKNGWDLVEGEEILALDPKTDEIVWQPVESVFTGQYTGSMVHLTNHLDALVTPNHRWLVEQRRTRAQVFPLEARRIGRTLVGHGEEQALADFPVHARLVVGGGTPIAFRDQPKWDDEVVETVGWYLTEGSDCFSGPNRWHSIQVSQSPSHNPEHVASIRRLAHYWQSQGATFSESASLTKSGCASWYLGKGVVQVLEEAAPEKNLIPDFIMSLTYHQALLLHKVLMDGDGSRCGTRESWYQQDGRRKDGFQMLSALLGKRVNTRGDFVDTYQRRAIEVASTLKSAESVEVVDEPIWCPTVEAGIWFARRNGNTYWTGNSPTTVIMGAKSNDLIRGPKKVWAIPNEKAQIQNLELNSQLQGPLDWLAMLKEKMHELVGIPVNALGQPQEISNTSGVALSLQFLPLIQKRNQKITQYGPGFEQLNELIIRVAALYLPGMLQIDPDRDPPLEDGQLQVLDPADPLTYNNTVDFASPLPIDKLIALNEIQMEMMLGLESKTGALRKLGEPYPAEKLQELIEELHQDALEQGALDLLNNQIQMLIATMTGMTPMGPGQAPQKGAGGAGGGPGQGGVQSAGGPGVNSAGAVMGPSPQFFDDPDVKALYQQLTTLSAGTKLPQVRNPLKDLSDRT